MFSYVALEERIPIAHPLRGVRKLADAVLFEMSKEFEGMYAKVGRPSTPPERLFRALLLQVFYSVRSERLGWIPGSPRTGTPSQCPPPPPEPARQAAPAPRRPNRACQRVTPAQAFRYTLKPGRNAE
jgi:hypothetical protein